VVCLGFFFFFLFLVLLFLGELLGFIIGLGFSGVVVGVGGFIGFKWVLFYF